MQAHPLQCQPLAVPSPTACRVHLASLVSPHSLVQGQPREAAKPVSNRGPQKMPPISVVAFDAAKKRVFFGLDNGDLCFWPLMLTSIGGGSSSRYVGSHKVGAFSSSMGRCQGRIRKIWAQKYQHIKTAGRSECADVRC